MRNLSSDNEGAPEPGKTGERSLVVRSIHDLEDFLDSASVGLHWVGVDGTILWANRADYEPLGYTSEEYIGHNITEFHTDPQAIEDILRRLSSGERIFEYLAKLRCKDGSVREVAITSSVLFEEGGRFKHTRCFTRDITEEKKMEQALRESESRFRAMFELVAVGMAQADPITGRFLEVNQKLSQMTGYTAEELMGMTFVQLTHPDDRARDFHAFKRMVGGEDPVYTREKRYLHKDGRVVWVLVSATLIRDRRGRPERTVAAIQEVTDRRHAEERIKAITSNATLGLLMTDHRQHCVFLNPAAEKILGFSLVELQGRPLHAFVHHTRPDGEPYSLSECPIDRALPERTQQAGEDFFVRKDGSFYPIAFTASPIVQDGNAIGTVLELRDLTDEKRKQEERERLLSELQKAVQVRDEFLSVASHELKTPLTPLSLKLQMLARELQANPESPHAWHVQSYIETGKKQLKRLNDLVGDLLDVSRIQVGRLKLEREEVDLSSLVQEVACRFEAQAKQADSTLDVRAPVAVVGWWDRLRLEQVVTNLVDNALKYGSGRPVQIEVSWVNGVARLCVTDHGIGIEEKSLSRVFERFERAVSDRNYGGLGLGLYITREIVQALSGTISVQSEPAVKTQFTVDLPKHPPISPIAC